MPKSLPFSVVVPTLNAARDWPQFAPALLQCVLPEQVVIIDSESTDGTPELAQRAGFRTIHVPRSQFNHGGTRQKAIQFIRDAEIVVFLTQDAVLASPTSIAPLLDAFNDSRTGAAFGRQLARPGAGAIERHARLFNYPGVSSVRTVASSETMGFKTIFFSNSFAAYRRVAFDNVGGFPTDVIMGEDTITAAKLLLSGWNVHYVAEAEAYHSHSYSCWQEFRRYFDTGVLHERESWLQREFGGTGGEGKRFVQSELVYLWHNDRASIPSAFARTAAKLAGYRLGRFERIFSAPIKSRLSMHSGYWNR